MDMPDAEQLKRFRIEQAYKTADQEQNRDTEQYVENELDLKSNIILKPQAKEINPMNRPDLVLGVVKDPQTKLNLEYWKDMQIMFYESGMLETAQFYENKVLTTLNLHRSHDGQQQIYIISRIKQNRIDLDDKKSSMKDRMVTI